MTRNRKRLFSILLSLVLMLGAVPIEGLVMVAHADEKVLSGSMNETANDGDVLTGSTSGRVTIASGAKITLSNVTITVKYSPCQGQSNFAPLKTAVEGSRL